MSNSIVKVTEVPVNDSLILVIGEDGIITPDKRTLEAYLSKSIYNFCLYYNNCFLLKVRKLVKLNCK